MSNWISHYAMHLQKLKVREILPQNADSEIHINEDGGDTFLHGKVHFEDTHESIHTTTNHVLVDPGTSGYDTHEEGTMTQTQFNSMVMASIEKASDDSDFARMETERDYFPLTAGLEHKISGTMHLEGDRVINVVSGEAGKLKYNGGDRFKWGSGYMWCFKPLDMQEHRVLNVHSPEQDGDAANKKYVDDKVGGVPVGSIMFWLHSAPPSGWFKLHGGTFDVGEYPKLHEYLLKSSGYSLGYLPNWAGRYPVEYGDHVTADLGTMVGFRTALPKNKPITAKTSSIPDGKTRTFNGAGGTNAYSDGLSQINVSLSGGDNVTRPPSVVGHYIIKHD